MNKKSQLPVSTPPPKPRGLPLWSAIIALLVLALLGLASLGALLYFTRSDKAKLERQLQAQEAKQAQTKLEEQKVAADTKLTLARTRQDEVLAQSRNATNVLTRLLQANNDLIAQATALKGNEAGRNVALHPELVAQARRIYESDLAGLISTDEIVAKLESVRRIEQQIVTSQGTSYEPAANLSVNVQNAVQWADQARRKVSQVQASVSDLVSESKIKVTSATITPNSPTLESAIAKLSEAESGSSQRAIVAKTAQANVAATETVGNAEAQRIVEEARIQAAKIVSDAKDAAAKQERADSLRQAENKVEDTKTAVAAKQKEDNALQIKLREKASRPEIQTKLAPFITPGFVQVKGMSYEKKSYSLAQLQSAGLLAQTPQGMRSLNLLASSRKDLIRPRWHLSPNWLSKPGAEFEMVKETQQLLIELGPALVEMKLLEP